MGVTRSLPSGVTTVVWTPLLPITDQPRAGVGRYEEHVDYDTSLTSSGGCICVATRLNGECKSVKNIVMKIDIKPNRDELLVPDLTCKQAQDALQISATTVWRLLKNGKLTQYKVGNSTRIHRQSVLAIKTGGAK
jgi:excisionase family DNA binding protein